MTATLCPPILIQDTAPAVRRLARAEAQRPASAASRVAATTLEANMLTVDLHASAMTRVAKYNCRATSGRKQGNLLPLPLPHVSAEEKQDRAMRFTRGKRQDMLIYEAVDFQEDDR